MIKNQARAEQFYSRSGSESTKGSRKGYSILGGGEDVVAHLTDEQKRNNLVTRLKWLRLMLGTTGLTLEEEQEKRALEKEFKSLQKNINAKNRPETPLSRHFMDVCEETMTREQFYKVLEMAQDRQKRLLSK